MTVPPTDTQIAQMRRNTLSTIAERNRTRRCRGLIGIACAATVLVAGTTAAGFAIHAASVGEQNTFYECYSEADVNGAHTGAVRMDQSDYDRLDTLPMQQRVRDALDLCAASYANHEGGALTVANPTVCVLRDQRLGVFPNDAAQSPSQFCGRLGLTAP